MALENVKDIFDKMPGVFDADAAQGLSAVFQFEITGDDGGNWNIVVQDGTCEVVEGTHAEPSVTLTMSAETWLGMINKRLTACRHLWVDSSKLPGTSCLPKELSSYSHFSSPYISDSAFDKTLSGGAKNDEHQKAR